ncbi:MAG: tyrosine-type recombinase/integrase [Pseudonocardiaceae bacterium]
MSTPGRTFRRCACRDPITGKQLATCPKLAADSRHGSWYFALPQPAVRGHRKPPLRRGGFPTRKTAQAALDKLAQRQRDGITTDDRETVAEYLRAWLPTRRNLKPTTVSLYRAYLENDLIPAIGSLPLERLSHVHVAGLISDLEAAGRGAVTVRRITATLSSAMSDAVKRRRLPHNPARFAELPKVTRAERGGWGVAEAVAFLTYITDQRDRDAELWELLIATGMRKGEALALRWSDLDLPRRVAHVTRTLSVIEGSALVFTAPKTKGSAAGVGLSKRVVAALERQRTRQNAERREWGSTYEDGDLVFARENGAPLRPEHVLRRFRALSKTAGLPAVRVHDLRHLAASMMIAAGVPLPIVSKTLRHSTVSITSDIYAHMTADIAREAVDSLAAVLDAAEAEATAAGRTRVALTEHTEHTLSPPHAPTDSHETHTEGERSA